VKGFTQPERVLVLQTPNEVRILRECLTEALRSVEAQIIAVEEPDSPDLDALAKRRSATAALLVMVL
jgi:hypothetical protein